jgi:hypothetical protein
VGAFNTPISSMHTSPRQKINRDFRVKLHHRSNELHRHLHDTPMNLVCGAHIVSAALGNFSKIENILNHKASLKFKIIEIFSYMLLDNRIKLEINIKRTTESAQTQWISSNILLNDQWVIEEMKKKS